MKRADLDIDSEFGGNTLPAMYYSFPHTLS
jgi:hypothetical protein